MEEISLFDTWGIVARVDTAGTIFIARAEGGGEYSIASLTLALSNQFEAKFSDLPAELQPLADKAVFVEYWDELSPEERRRRVLNWDYAHLPTTAHHRKASADLRDARWRVQREMAAWQSLSPRTITEKAKQDEAMKDLHGQLRLIEEKLARIDEGRERFLVGLAQHGARACVRVRKTERISRPNDLGIELDDVLRAMQVAGERITPSSVMLRLKARAGRKDSCIAKALPEGVSWIQGSTGCEKELTLEKLKHRLKRWRQNV